jgi:hypothetical protein
VYNAVTSGSVTFTHTVQATNADTGALISLTPINTTVLVVNPAAILSSVGVASPGQLSVGQTATLLLSVSNSGGAQALNLRHLRKRERKIFHDQTGARREK